MLGLRLKIGAVKKHLHIQLRTLTHHIHLTSALFSGLKKYSMDCCFDTTYHRQHLPDRNCGHRSARVQDTG